MVERREGKEGKGMGDVTIEAVPSAATSSVEVPGGQSVTTPVGQYVEVSLPIQKRWPLALTVCRWMGLPERPAMRPKGAGVVY